jgi:large subunit ribosomal protein L21
MQYAVIKSGGKQYKVSPGQTLTVDKLSLDGKNSTVFDEVLLVVDEGKANVGKPNVKGATVEATLVEHKRGEKIHVRRFKAKSRYRRTTGFRAEQSVFKIDKISFDSKKNSKAAEEKTDSKEDK